MRLILDVLRYHSLKYDSSFRDDAGHANSTWLPQRFVSNI